MAHPNFKNRTLYHGDNLAFLRGMNSETVHLIATDPPFNKNRDFHATPDSLAKGARFSDRWSWERDVHEEWTDSIIDDWPAVWEVILAARSAYGNDMGAFLCWLGVRLMEMRRVLRPDGSIYLHCDPTASHYIKSMLDAIFGWKNFRNEIVWKRQTSNNAVTKKYGQIVDYILFYSKGPNAIWNQVYHTLSASELKEYRRDKDGRYYKTDDLTAPGTYPHRQFTWRGATPSKSRSWGFDKETLESMLAQGKIELARNGNAKLRGRINYLDDNPGQKAQSIWTDIQRIGNTAKERTGYPTQKPLALYERIIKASSNPGDTVLDPFCGCATTPVAAERLKRQWIGMDIWDGARDIVLARLQDEWLFTPDEAEKKMFPHVIHIETAPPIRTDDNEMAAPTLKLKIQRPVEPWQRMTHKQMVRVLAFAQTSSSGIICAGCGRVLEVEFMELDHIQPRAEGGENHILNRILLCGPCNGRKGSKYTLRGLVSENKKKAVGWMQNEDRAKMARDAARQRAQWVRDFFDTAECQALIHGD